MKKNKVILGINRFLLSTIGNLFPNIIHPFGKLGNHVRVFFVKRIAEFVGKKVIVAKHANIKPGVILDDFAEVGINALVSRNTHIKSNVLMGPNCKIFTQNHVYDETKHSFTGYSEIKPVTIGNNVWIGYNVVILPGVTIGDNCIIGACSVVTHDIPAGVMAAGNPCVVKKVIDQEVFKKSNL